MSTTSDRVTDTIVRLKSEGTFAKLDEHIAVVPKVGDELLVEQVFTYYASDRKPVIFNPATSFCVELNAVKFFPMLARAYVNLQDTTTPIVDLIEYNKIYPFAFFVNGRFIPWENMKLVVYKELYYFFIEFTEEEMDFCRQVRTVETMNLLILPTHTVYSIGVNGGDQYNNLFSFDSMGLYNETEWTHAFYMPVDCRTRIEKFYNITLPHTFSFRENASHKYSEDNFFFWGSDGLYGANAQMKFAGGLVKIEEVEDYETVTCIACTSATQTSTLDNINKASYTAIQSSLPELVNGTAASDSWIYQLNIPLDSYVAMDKNLDYATNRKNFIQNILKYRTDLFYELYELELNFFTLSIDYEWIMSHRDEDGYMNIPRRSSKGKDYYVVLFVNGELYEYYKHHFYEANRFLCPVAAITEIDDVELMFFKDASEYAFETAVNQDDDYAPLSEKYFNDSTLIFCKETADTYFTFPDDGDQHFPVPYSYDTDENGNRKIVFESDFYYGKTVTVVPDRTFRYYGFYVGEEDTAFYKVSLGTTFYSCYDYDRYMIFFNGRRLTNDQYRLTLPCRSTTPFFRFEIYLAVPLEYGDRLDIFYLPDTIRDLEVDPTLDANGVLTIDKSTLEYILGSRLYTVWVNGKKLTINQMADLDSLTIQLTKDPQSLKHAKITKMGSGIEEIETEYQAIDTLPLWDQVLDLHGNPYTLTGITPATVDDAEADTYAGAVPIVSVMWELIREHYIGNAVVDVTTAFIYDYLDQDNTAFDGIDQAGNSIIDAMNAERTDNIDQIERYYP